MKKFLILQLEGVTQSWGTETLEDFRPTSSYPTQSAILGLLGACLGIERKEIQQKTDLANSIDTAILAVQKKQKRFDRIEDFHTVLNATKVDGSVNKHAVLSTREYLCDSSFLVAIEQTPSAVFSLEKIVAAVKRPYYTPFLGRRSCPPSKPIFKEVVESTDLESALARSTSSDGVLYSSTPIVGASTRYVLRDVPKYDGHCRQFKKRTIYVKTIQPKEVNSVS